MCTVTVPILPVVPQVYSRRSSNTAKHKVLLKRRNVILALVVSIIKVMYVLSRSDRCFLNLFSNCEGRKEGIKINSASSYCSSISWLAMSIHVNGNLSCIKAKLVLPTGVISYHISLAPWSWEAECMAEPNRTSRNGYPRCVAFNYVQCTALKPSFVYIDSVLMCSWCAVSYFLQGRMWS